MLIQQLRSDDNITELFQESLVVASSNPRIQGRLEPAVSVSAQSPPVLEKPYRASTVNLLDRFCVTCIPEVQRLRQPVSYTFLKTRSSPRGKVWRLSICPTFAWCLLHRPTFLVLTLSWTRCALVSRLGEIRVQ